MIDEVNKGDYSALISIILIIIGVVFLIYGSELFVSSAINFANRFNISEAVIGLSLIAFGTSLPELVVGIMSAIKRKVDFALGNILGSNIYNVLGVLGISSFFGTFSMPEIIAKQDLAEKEIKIINYLNSTKNKYWKGECFVFDDRILLKGNS